jgi:hypothetical protein
MQKSGAAQEAEQRQESGGDQIRAAIVCEASIVAATVLSGASRTRDPVINQIVDEECSCDILH